MTDSYLEDAARTVTFKITWKVTVGHHLCSVCGVDSPPPTDDQLLDFAMDRSADFYAASPREYLGYPGHESGHSYMWVGDDSDQYMPVGWGVDGERQLICPDCIAVVKAALNKRRKTR